MFDTVGSRLSFSVAAGLQETFRVSFWRGAAGFDVSGATFQAAAYEAHGVEHALVCVLPVEQDEAANAVRVTVPALEEGHFLWELRAVDESGVEERLLHGVLTALSAESALGLIDGAAAGDLREVAVQQAGGSAGELVLRWQVCSVAGAMAAAAAGSAAAAAGSAAAAAGITEAAERRVEEQVRLLEGAREAVERLNGSIADAIKISPAGTLVIGGVDTHHPVQGPPGQSGAEVQYHVIGSAADLPTDAEHCSALHRYVVNQGVSTKASEEIYMGQVAGQGQHGVKIDGVSYVVSMGDLSGLIAAINSAENCPVNATDKTPPGDLLQYTIGLEARTAGADGNFITVEKIGTHITVPHPTLQGGADGGVFQYVWADGQWVVLSLTASTIATQTSHGYVRLGVPGGSGNMFPVVEGADGGVYVNVPSLAEPVPYPVEGSTAPVEGGGIRAIIENRSNPATQELVTGGGGADKCQGMGWIDLGPRWTRLMPDTVESIGLRCRPDGQGAQANAYMEISPASDFSWGVKRSVNAQTQSPGAMCVWTFPPATNFCNGVDRVYIRLVNAAGVVLPLACAVYVTKVAGDTTVIRRVNGGVIQQLNVCPQMVFTGKSDLALALAELEGRVVADAVTGEELEAALLPYETAAHAAATYETKAAVTALGGRVSNLDGTLRELIASGDSRVEALLDTKVSMLTSWLSGKVAKTDKWTGDVVLTQDEYDALPAVDPLTKYYIVEE